MPRIASERSAEKRLTACYGALCAATLATSVLLMARATYDTTAPGAEGPGQVQSLRPPPGGDPRFASLSPTGALPIDTVGKRTSSPHRRLSP